MAKDAGVRAAASAPHRFNRVQQPVSPYLCIPRHIPDSYEYFPSARFTPDIISGDANFVLDDPTGFYFAVLSSAMFMTWQKTVGGRIKNDPRFASTVTWNTFPLVGDHQPPSVDQRRGGDPKGQRGNTVAISRPDVRASPVVTGAAISPYCGGRGHGQSPGSQQAL